VEQALGVRLTTSKINNHHSTIIDQNQPLLAFLLSTLSQLLAGASGFPPFGRKPKSQPAKYEVSSPMCSEQRTTRILHIFSHFGSMNIAIANYANLPLSLIIK